MCLCSHSFMLSIDLLHRREACQESGLTRSGWGRRHAFRNLLAEQSRISWLSVSSQAVSMSVGAVIDIISGFLPIPISCSSPRSILLLSGGLDPKIRRDDRKVSPRSFPRSLPSYHFLQILTSAKMGWRFRGYK